MIAAKVCCMVGAAAFASTLVELTKLWHLDSSRAGWISSAYLVGYTVAVPILVGLTDSIDARAIYLGGCVIGAAAFTGFAYLAHGLWSAFLFQALAGVSLAGAYMPGLRILTQRLPPRARIRAIPYYTGAFGIGTSLSFLISGWAAARYGWEATFTAGAIGSIGAAALMVLATWGITVEPDFAIGPRARHPLDFRPVLHNRNALAYVLAYGGHSWELFAFRAWLPTFLLLAWQRSRTVSGHIAVARWSALIVLIGVPASIIGAEAAHKWSRNRLLRLFELTSIVASTLAAAFGKESFSLAVLTMFLYNLAITADSGALTAGTVATTRAEDQGAILAVYSMVGFAGGAIGPSAAGTMLAIGGGFSVATSWYLGFMAMAVGSALAATALTVVSKPLATGRTQQSAAPVVRS
jgi:MFS family permease